MSSIPQSMVNGGEVGRGTRPRKLYRYKPVPPFAVDEEGYPCEDSKSEDSDHIALFGYGMALKRHLEGRAAVHSYLSTHYSKGDRGAVIVPDLFAAFGGEERSYRRSYKLWEDPPPEFVLELLSEDDWCKDVGLKKDTYEFLGVQECWLYDPRVRWLDAPLEGYRLRGGVYEAVEPASEGRFESEALGLELRLRDGELRFFEPKTGAYIRTLDEEAEDAAQARSEAAQARSEAAQARLEAAEAQERLAETQTKAAQSDRRAMEAERRASESERELAALRAELEQQGSG